MGSFIHHRTVEFHETDAAGLVHFSNYFRYAESAEHALYRSIDYSMMKKVDGAFLGWPRVRAQAKYSAPLDSGDVMRIELWIAELKDKAIDWNYKIFKDKDDTLAAKGSFVTLHVRFDALTRDMLTLPIPEELRTLLAPFVGD